MSRTVAAAKPVAPAAEADGVDYYGLPAGSVELRWADSEFHTGVTLSRVHGGETMIGRQCKGDRLYVNLTTARHGMAPVIFTDGQVVGYLGTPSDGPVQYATWEQHRATAAGALVEWTEYDNVETALVDLAFWYVS